MTIKNKAEKLRFGAVGAFNTVLDFGLLFLLRGLGLPTIPANIISSTTAFCFSFIANKKITFQAKGTNLRREVTLFVIITLFGLWVLQSIVILTLKSLLSGVQLDDNLVLFIAKILATIVTLVWNYVLYSRVVFKKD